MKKNSAAFSRATHPRSHKPHPLPLWLPYLILALVLVCAIAAVMFALRGCNQQTDAAALQPHSDIRGYYASDQVVTGGEDLHEVSIYDVNVEQKGQDVVISMQFQYNNTTSQDDVRITSLVPRFSLEILPQPYRLAITLESVTEWTFTGKTSWLDYDLIQGAFVAPPTYESADNPTVIFHLAGDVAYQVKENDGTLEIRLRPLDTQLDTYYYVLVNGISEYASYAPVRECGLTPTLCSDSVHTLLISQGFETKQEAESFAAQIDPVIQTYMPGKTALIQQLAPDALPTFAQDLEAEEIAAMPILYRNGQSESAQVLLTNASVLCSSPEADVLLCYSPQYTLDSQTGETVYAETLYLYDKNQTQTQLTQKQFATLLYAQFSADGRKIAFLDYDSDANTTALYCFDRDTEELSLLSDADFGTFVYDFVWNPASDTIYAITLNDDGSMSIRSCSIENGQTQKQIICSLNASVGMLGVTQDALYYSDTDTDGENATIYRMRFDNGSVEPIIDGARFLISPDGRYLAADAAAGLTIVDLQSQKTLAVLECAKVQDFHFRADSSQLLCVVDAQNGQSQYPSDVYLFDTAQNTFQYLFATDCVDLDFSLERTSVLVNDTYYTQSGYIPVVYQVNF